MWESITSQNTLHTQFMNERKFTEKNIKKAKKTEIQLSSVFIDRDVFPLNTCGHKQFVWYFFFRLSYLLLMMTVLCSPCNKNKSKFGVGIIKTLINGYCKMIAYRMRGREKNRAKWYGPTLLFGEILLHLLFHS